MMAAYTIALFGAFRDYGAEVHVSGGAPITAGALKNVIAQHMGQSFQGLVASAVLTRGVQVCGDDDAVSPDDDLGLLPPVSGG
jgi:molybdopterin converting factor small subunit